MTELCPKQRSCHTSKYISSKKKAYLKTMEIATLMAIDARILEGTNRHIRTDHRYLNQANSPMQINA